MIPALGGRFRWLATTVLLTVAVWVSALPVAFLLVVPRVGIEPAIAIAIGLLAGIFLVVVAAGRPGQSSAHGGDLAGRPGGSGGGGERACPAKTSASSMGRPQEERRWRPGFRYRTDAAPAGPRAGGADHELECRPLGGMKSF